MIHDYFKVVHVCMLLHEFACINSPQFSSMVHQNLAFITPTAKRRRSQLLLVSIEIKKPGYPTYNLHTIG